MLFVIDIGFPAVLDAITFVTVPAPIAALKLVAVNAVTVLSALNRGNEIAEGLVKVNIS